MFTVFIFQSRVHLGNFGTLGWTSASAWRLVPRQIPVNLSCLRNPKAGLVSVLDKVLYEVYTVAIIRDLRQPCFRAVTVRISFIPCFVAYGAGKVHVASVLVQAPSVGARWLSGNCRKCTCGVMVTAEVVIFSPVLFVTYTVQQGFKLLVCG